jgi:ribosomal protein L6P/L9E
MWNAGYKQSAAVGTFTSIVKNAIVGVTEVSKSSIKALFGT